MEKNPESMVTRRWLALLAVSELFVINPALAATIFSDNFQGYTSFPNMIPMGDPVNAGIPKISEGAAEIWYGARFETPDSGASIDSDLAIQKFGGGANMSHTGRFEDDAGLLFKLNTTGLSNVALSFDWRTFSATSNDKLVVGYHIGSIPGFGTCAGGGESGCYADLRTSLPWYTTQTGTTLTGNWTQLARYSASDTWHNAAYALSGADNQSEVWVALWLDNGEGDYGKIDNVMVTATVVPVPAAVWLFGSGLLGLMGIATQRRAWSIPLFLYYPR